MLRVLHLMRGFFGTGRRTANAEGHLPVVEQWRLRVTDRSDPTPEAPPEKAPGGRGARLLDPIDRNSEILFGSS